MKFGFKTLQGRFIVLLVIPCFFIILTGEILSFLHARDAIVSQWNKSTQFKLLNAAHLVERRLFRPIESLDALFPFITEEGKNFSPDGVIFPIQRMEGVLQVAYLGRQDLPSPLIRHENCQLSRVKTSFVHGNGSMVTLVVHFKTFQNTKPISHGLEISLGFDHLFKDIKSLSWRQNHRMGIINGSGEYVELVQNSGFLVQNIGSDLFGAVQRAGVGSVFLEQASLEYMAGFHKLDPLPWTLVLFSPKNHLLKDLLRYWGHFVLGGLVLWISVILLSRRHMGKILGQISNLSEKAQMVASGDYQSPLPVTSKDEIGQLTCCFNEITQGLKERDFIRNSFEKYVDPEFARCLIEQPEVGNPGGSRREVVMMMSDIRRFTALSETLSPEILIRVLNDYFSIMIDIIHAHNGIIVDFFGDAVLAFFDTQTASAQESALASVRCASAMQRQMMAFNVKMAREKLPGMEMGIGIHAGQVVVGNIGSKIRLKYGVVGASVNMVSRIQGCARGGEIIISDEAYHYIESFLSVKEELSVELKGISSPVRLRCVQLL